MLNLKFFLLVIAPFSCLALPNYGHVKARDLSCMDFTLDKCTVELSGLIEQVKDIDEAFCQKYCSVIYAGRCQFFIYDRKQRICSLLSNPIEDYVETCDKVAGPKTPTIEDCQTGGDPCTSFLEGYCRFEGNLLENLENIGTATICQLACTFKDSCKYFLYDIKLKNCELFDDEKRECDLIRGPPTPDYESCFVPTTTMASTTTTEEDTTMMFEMDEY